MTAVDLADFLLARIAEDRMVALGAAAGPWSVMTDRGSTISPSTVRSAGGYPVTNTVVNEPTADHIARWDKVRVLAECEAKRHLVTFITTEVSQTVRLVDHDLGRSIDDDDRLLKLMALPYADHPDYRQEWAP